MARNVYGLDLGTYEIKIYDKKKEQIWKIKNVIATHDKKHIFSVGSEAYEMYEKAPDNIQVVFPMHNGVIAHFNDMQYLLQNLLGPKKQFSRGAQYVIAVPTDVTEVEKRAFYDLVSHSTAKAKSVRIVERGIADAVGMGLDIWNEKGIFVANFGGETTELSVLASGGMVLNRLVKVGGIHFDTAIVNLVRHNRDFLIGRVTAEKLRKKFGVFEQDTDTSLTVAGRDLITGVPKQESIPISLVRAAMKEPLAECVHAIKIMIDRTPPDVHRRIEQNGIYLTGGLANLEGLSTYLEESTGLKVTMAQIPELCAVTGLKKIISNKDYRKLTYSMLDEDYRWLR
ncbi:rod shape-determining protein [Muricomes intestini]|jgi:rod shape-determining protein MreB|uniref:Rod shape-determining protein MreB n=1 Tax=Muricomes intestini TaxID=1796634 RepID=A0A4R3KHT3_9FIRM|nr:rod shape-determining protein [Muricomes intestini]TCS82876.1 rod shape-determining protein MreB [Muricomes intestini]HAX51906.1 rod shape-determining protein [Lachnospiraceae bacterium]HCR84063.1 rod shape-determining protein [Lachnospiraceae bacterium]